MIKTILLLFIMNFLSSFDQLVYQHIFTIQHEWATSLMIFVTNLFSPVTLPIFALALIGWFWYKKQKSTVILIILGLGGGLFFESVLKLLIARSRPSLGLITETGYSFPSGHATLSAVFFSLLIYCFSDRFKNPVTLGFFIFFNVFLCLLVGFSRLYLGVHWLSDVVVGFVIGIVWFGVLLKVMRKR